MINYCLIFTLTMRMGGSHDVNYAEGIKVRSLWTNGRVFASKSESELLVGAAGNLSLRAQTCARAKAKGRSTNFTLSRRGWEHFSGDQAN